MKYVVIALLLVGVNTVAFSQKKIKSHRLTTEERAKMTPEQRLVHESQRKANKKGHLSNKKKKRIQEKESRKAQRIRSPKRKT